MRHTNEPSFVAPQADKYSLVPLRKYLFHGGCEAAR